MLSEHDQEQAKQLAEKIHNAKCVSVISGAGLSTESGLPDFRSTGGLWDKYDPIEAGSLEAFRKNPGFVWEYYHDRLKEMNPLPNKGHEAVSVWSKRDNWGGIITQNVDGLHQKAGLMDPIEIHGNLTRCVCIGKRHIVEMEEALADRKNREDGVPRCQKCNSRLKPDIVLFGEQLPDIASSRAEKLLDQTDLLIVLGSSLAVHPVAQFPLWATYNKQGAEVAIITKGETPYDNGAILDYRRPWMKVDPAIRSEAPLGEFLTETNQYLKEL